MTALARSLFRLRKRVVESWGLLLALAVWPLLAAGAMSIGGLWNGELLPISIAAMFALALGRRLLRELAPGLQPRPRAQTTALVHELELGLLLLTGLYLLIALTGGLRSFLYPLVYALASFLMILHRSRWAAASWLLAVGLLELALWTAADRVPWQLVATHLTFIGFFAAGNLLVLSGLVRRMRWSHRRQIEQQLQSMRQEARDFRLIASQLPLESRARRREEEELRMAQGAVESIHEQLYHTLDLLRTTLGLQTCVLLWVRHDGPATDGRGTPGLLIKELATGSELVGTEPRIDAPGLLAGVLRNPKPLRLKALAGKRIPPYYQGPEAVTDLCVVPLMDGASLRGLLCADRCDDRPFSEVEEQNLQKTGNHILRAIEHERVFTAVERGKYEQEQFYRASELLNQALTVEDVYQKTFSAVRALADYDLAAITSYDAHAGTHEVLAVDQPGGREDDKAWSELAGKLRGLTFEDGSGLVAMALKNRHYMPAGGELLDPDTVVFNARTRLRRAKSLLVLPLIHGEQVLGSVVLATSKPGQYPEPTREMLRVISHHVGVSLQNARMYQSMELRATTDGLTGLTNHRAFQERLAQLHALSERTGHGYSVILTDIDHFKSINDTYGHPIGDQVLKRVAGIFAGRVRKVDIVARYGGEEFVLVLPDTDGAGAAHFANKLREEVAAETLTSEHGNFSVTISMGVAEFPHDGADRQALIEHADQALYHCKEHGRNCVKRWSEIR